MIKGRYVCQVEMDFEYDDKIHGEDVNIEDVRARLTDGWMDDMVRIECSGLLDEARSREVKVTRQYADVVQVGDST